MLIQVHPWVTAHGIDPLLSAEENTAEMVTHVTEKDYADAIKGIRGVMHVVLFSLCLNNIRFERSTNLKRSVTGKIFHQAQRRITPNRPTDILNLLISTGTPSHLIIDIISRNSCMII